MFWRSFCRRPSERRLPAGILGRLERRLPAGILAAFVLLPIGAHAQQKTPLLKIQVEHNETLKKLPSALKPGNTFSPKKMPPLGKPKLKWVLIPYWMAGAWESNRVVYTYNHSFLNNQTSRANRGNMEKRSGVYGTQADKNGNVYQLVYVPFANQVETADRTIVSQTTEWDFPKITPTEVVEHSISLSVFVNKQNNRIVAVSRDESIKRMCPGTDGVIRVDDSVRRFDTTGKRIDELHLVYSHQRTKPFKPAGSDELRKDFELFLQRTNETAPR